MDSDHRQGIEKRKPACDLAVGMGVPARPLPHRPVRDGKPAQRFFSETRLAGDIPRAPPGVAERPVGRLGGCQPFVDTAFLAADSRQ